MSHLKYFIIGAVTALSLFAFSYPVWAQSGPGGPIGPIGQSFWVPISNTVIDLVEPFTQIGDSTNRVDLFADNIDTNVINIGSFASGPISAPYFTATSTSATSTMPWLTTTNLEVTGFIDTPLTQGSVLFAGAGGLLSEDNASLFFDDSNNRLGIGTSTPAVKLQVTSNDADKLFLTDSTEPLKQLRLGYNSSGNYGTIQSIQSGTAFTPLILNGSGGNVGIGTTSPDSILHLEGSGTQNLLIRGVGSSDQTIQFGRDDNASNWIVGRDNTNSVFGIEYSSAAGVGGLTSNADFIITQAGNVGIGTSSPGYLLDVDGDFNVGEAGIAQAFFVDATAGKVAVGENAHSLTNLDGKGIVITNTAGGATGRLRIDVENISSGYNTEIRANDTGLEFEAASNSRNISFWTGATPAERITVLGTGNVGIGETVPTSLLHVGGTANIAGILTLGSTITGNVDASGFVRGTNFAATNTSGEVFGAAGGFIDINDGTDRVTFGISSGAHIGSVGARDFYIRTDATNRVTVQATTGNVGIGTNAPSNKLEIDAANRLGSTFTGTTAGEGLRVTQTDYISGNYVSLLEGGYDDGVDAPNVRIAAMYDGGGSNLAIGTSNSYGSGITNLALWINSIGQLSVGTSTEGADFQLAGSGTSDTNVLEITDTNGAALLTMQNDGDTVFGPGTATIGFAQYAFSAADNTNAVAFLDNNGNGRHVFRTDASGNAVWRSFNNKDLKFGVNSIDTVTLAYNGGNDRLGIGTSTPWAKLAVDAQGAVNNAFYVASSTSPYFFIGTDGKVGIGTTTPQSTLDVEGAARSAQVALSDGATITVDVTTGNKFNVTLGGNRAIDFTNVSSNRAGQGIELEICQDGTGSRTVTWDADTIFVTGSPLETTFTAPTLSTTANVCNVFAGSISNGTSTTRVRLGY